MKSQRFGNRETGYKITLNNNSKPHLEIIYYPNSLKRNHDNYKPIDSEQLVSISKSDFQIDVKERYARPVSDWPEIVDFILAFATYEIAKGFFSKIGHSIYKSITEKLAVKLKDMCVAWKDDRGRARFFGAHISFPYVINGNEVIVLLAIRINDIDLLSEKDVISVTSYVEEMFQELSFKEVLLLSSEVAPYWEIVYYQDINNNYINVKRKLNRNNQ